MHDVDDKFKSRVSFMLVAITVLALTIGLASAYGPKVRSNAILPGEVLTDIALAWTPEQRAAMAGHSPLGRGGEAADFVGTAVWLASDASAWVTGTLTRVDGGFFRQMS